MLLVRVSLIIRNRLDKYKLRNIIVFLGVVDVDIEDPNGDIEQAYVYFNNDMNLTYTISYMPKIEGQHKVIVRYSGIEITNSPFYVQVEHPVEDCPNFKVSNYSCRKQLKN